MDYTVALIVYVCGLLGFFISMGSMIAYKEDRTMKTFGFISTFAFLFCIAMGNAMLNAVS